MRRNLRRAIRLIVFMLMVIWTPPVRAVVVATPARFEVREQRVGCMSGANTVFGCLHGPEAADQAWETLRESLRVEPAAPAGD